MTTSGEAYRQHLVWATLVLKREALETSRFSTQESERNRVALVALLKVAEKAKGNPQPYLYDAVLDELASWVNGLTGDESSVDYHLSRYGGVASLAELVRKLPGPTARNLTDRYVETLDAAITSREEALAAIEERVADLEDRATKAEGILQNAQTVAEAAKTQAAGAANQAKSSADALQEELERLWKGETDDWRRERTLARDEDSKLASEHIGVLAIAASLGDRLLEHTTATLVAKDWGERASRERRAGLWMRVLGLTVLACATLVGVWVVGRALEDGFDLTLGDGILRASLIAATAGLGAAALVESRRHYREADSSEEIELALTALEPYFASDTTQRAEARKALGEAVFVNNVLSRFAHRDAAKHADVSSLSISSVTDAVSEAAKTVTNVRQAGGS